MIRSRRHALRDIAAVGTALLFCPSVAFAAAPGERRFVFVIQRGAADGLHTLVPHGDPDYARQRGALAVDLAGLTKLDGMFGLHPALAETGRMYGAGQVIGFHAVASAYRERSHFDGQNVLETGGSRPYALKDGWMNRLVALMPGQKAEPIAFAPTVPLALRGAAPVTSYAASGLPRATDDLMARVEQLYSQDAALHALWTAATTTRDQAGEDAKGQDPATVGKLAAGFLARPDGPRIAMIETGGWDTHSGQAGRLAAQFKRLDTLLAALRDGMGPAWDKTVVLVATEFGRTVAVNGTGGTDHGTGSAALLVGGAVKGGRVIADWPGLATQALYEGRDLRPTAALEDIVAATVSETFGVDATSLFPDRARKVPFGGLIRLAQ
ncbi:DUF1501 domain-containing protein [Novosphingobium kaempferiae]|uniref:DUF1501 domain-containing protein n=1 Tax=Novosphingobium kaempferiae TaxID=2896849 RepID=UPI001E3A0893|nr:DUF1501 domain-containing protein [Novosphingobium kaempferiae]